jgi:hypothetical protein
MLLAGRAGLSEAALFLGAWTGLALVLKRPAALSLKDTAVSRGFGSSIWRLSRITASPNPNRLALDIAVHKVELSSLVEILFLGIVSCTVAALQVFPSHSVQGRLAMVAALSAAAATATLAGYVQMSSTVRTDPSTEAWIRTLPVSASALSTARHAVCAAGGLLAVLPVMVLAILKAGGPAEPSAYLVAAWAGMSVWALTGWFATYLAARGVPKHVAGYSIFAGYSVRTVIGTAVLVVWRQPLLIVLLFAADIGIGLVGQWRGALAATRERGQ